MRALVSGISGFVGSHLAELLLREGYDVYGLVRYRSKLENIQHIIPKLRLEYGDIRDAHSIEYVLNKVKPDYIFHLAAQSFVPQSWTAPLDTMDTNVKGTINLYEAVRKLGLDCVIQFAGSSEEYGCVREIETPITEENALKPLSPYGVSKVAGDRLSYQYVYSYKMKIVITRAFNHEGPRRGEMFVTSTFAKQIAEIENGAKPVIKVGNLKAQRDFTDVREAYLLSVQKCQYGVPYNICSGKAITMESLLNRLLSMTNICVQVEEDEERMRPSDVPVLLGDCSLFKNTTGWERSYSLDDTLEDLLNYWRGICQVSLKQGSGTSWLVMPHSKITKE
jgi:GDP-4-dehydro-6-deoxy-D-mannose reductase